MRGEISSQSPIFDVIPRNDSGESADDVRFLRFLRNCPIACGLGILIFRELTCVTLRQVRFSKIVPEALFRTAHNRQRINWSWSSGPSQRDESRDSNDRDANALPHSSRRANYRGLVAHLYTYCANAPGVGRIVSCGTISRVFNLRDDRICDWWRHDSANFLFHRNRYSRPLTDAEKKIPSVRLDSGELSESGKAYDNTK